ncbi:methyltransferase domain-containing protein [Nocardia sp. SYP-A9097]|uniref:class I SAM-dependent methyltransferase n=1 Tax=Nocardia sp. SYP-A9097 TaxID=2663237 RepID=UPI00129BCFC8|nr:methyltransferase domain-containing protein [Nocardia sp. SYP-A9097]MRH88934.1 methyltransferase domain-containing protein [Nocardia sp. SYP-A9097]
MDNSVTTWGVGDYPLMAGQLRPAAVAAVDAAAITSGDRVIDVATGTGNAALLAAERGAKVVGIDFEPELLRLAGERSRSAAIEVEWVPGEVGDLPVPDRSADVVLSVFGVMYATDHSVAARELARVAAPGARVVLASWIPGSTMPAMGQVLSDYLPPPPASSGPPSRWGDPAALADLLEPHRLWLTATTPERITLCFSSSGEAADFLVRTAGHIVSERDRLTAAGRWDELHRELCRFVEQRAEPGLDGLRLPLDYLLASAVKALD